MPTSHNQVPQLNLSQLGKATLVQHHTSGKGKIFEEFVHITQDMGPSMQMFNIFAPSQCEYLILAMLKLIDRAISGDSFLQTANAMQGYNQCGTI